MRMLSALTTLTLCSSITGAVWAQTPAPTTSAQPSSAPTSVPTTLEQLQAELAKLQQQTATEREDAQDRIKELEALVEALSKHVAGIDETMAQGGVPKAPSSNDKNLGALRYRGATFGGDWTWRVGKSSTSLGGYMSLKYKKTLDGDNNTGFGTFDAPRLVIFTHSTINDRISFSSELEFEHVGISIEDTFRFPEGEVVAEFAAMDFKFNDALSFRSGILLVPMGKFNLVHDEPIQDFTERSLVDSKLLPGTWFEPGLGVFGQKALGNDALLRYETYLIQGFTDRISVGDGLREARGVAVGDTNDNKGLVGRVSVEPYLGLELGISGYFGKYDTAGEKSLGIAALDATWRKGPVELVAEAVSVSLEEGVNDEGEPVPTAMQGILLEGHYHLYADFLRKFKGLRNPHFTLMGRFDYVDTDAAQDGGESMRLSGGVNFRPIEDYVLKLEYHRDLEGVDGSLQNDVKDDVFVFSTALSF